MQDPVARFWNLRLEAVKGTLEKNNFEVHVAADREAASVLVLDTLLPQIAPRTLSWGGSKTFVDTGLYDRLKTRTGLVVLDTYDKALNADEKLERRRQSLLVDLFITGTNAITAGGHLINLDMIGNRIAALTFGPRSVIVLAGRNKVVADLEAAWERIKAYAAPVNSMRLDKKTPCAATGLCHDCKSPQRICNTWTITEKSFPQGRVRVVLINEDLGF
ncbi:MAG: lactate utilization protein [Desulfobacterales bacterium]|nr:lactate utilization protein [Desulfobacterales bacterium]MDJ0853699.1 lactate utilization protein [Desulfobacterales bacterium]MDJ0888621.1 lactate utilization protein [Desulfobacterales bacterium]MDJ0988752.1 lactate utilization protein [Desulfobacterales bacterium]